MAVVKLPLDSLNLSYEFKVDLDGTTYTVAIRFNSRSAVWIMDLKTVNDDSIIMGIPLLLGSDLFGRFKDSRLPPGTFLMVNLESDVEEASETNLGTEVLLLYEEANNA